MGRIARIGLCLAALVTVAATLGYGWQLIDSAASAAFTRGQTEAPSHSGATPDADSSSEPSTGPAEPASAAAQVRDLLDQAQVLPSRPQIPGYERDCGPQDACVFGTEWTDDSTAPSGHNGCDTRNDVLMATLSGVEFSKGSPTCDVVAGSLVDPYSGIVVDYATHGARIHIDHLFPLAAAWDLGAAGWTLDRRTRFANDTELELLAVSEHENLTKGDSTPASWLPPAKSFRCEYVTRYLRVAVAYGLALTKADETVIRHVIPKC